MAGPFRVLMVCPQFRPLVGGYEQAAERLALALSARGHAITVLAERRDRAWAREEFLGRVRIRRLPVSPRRGAHTFSAIVSLSVYLLLRGRGFDVIHVHQYGWPSSLAVLFGAILRRPVVLKLTSTGPQGICAVLGRLHGERFHRALHRSLSACIVTSQRARDEIAGLGLAPARIHLIPNGLDTEVFCPPTAEARANARAMWRLGDSPLVVTVCQLRPEKNLPGLLEAWAGVRRSQPPARLAIVGDGTEMAGLKAQAERLGLGDSLLLPGNSPEPQAWYRAADIFVLSSSFEGLSNSLMEALCCGLAIVSTRVSGSEDIVEAADVGILVPVDDSAALGAALAELLADPDRVRASGLRAADYGAQHFSLESVSASVERLYAALAPTRSHPRSPRSSP